ncbi:MAG: CDC48 family AAA ATPase [Candidatus Pacearchaeota archaeon]
MKEKKDLPKGALKLRVVEALQDDAYKGVARIDPMLMRKLGLERGDIISIKDGRETFSIVDRAYPSDLGEEIIRIDGIARKNAKTSIGEKVEVKKANVSEAKKITIAPTQKGIVVQGDPENFKKGLIGKPVSKGDIIVIGGAQRKKDIMTDGFGDIFGEEFTEIFSQMGFGGIPGGVMQMRFLIVSTTPNQPVIITENTQISLSSKALETFDDTIPQITYEDIGGLSDEVKKVREMVELPLKRPEIFLRLGIEPPKGVLLYGPPGTGKTLLAKAVANESEASFITINGPEIFNKFYGESEKRIREIFDEAEKNAPAIIFIDELDAVAPSRESNIGSGEVERRVVSQLLTMMDGLASRGKVIVMAATNRPDSIDAALRRPGRFDREIEINAPSKEGRLSILKIHTRGMPITKNVNLEELAAKTHGFVGADLAALTKEAAMSVLRRNLHKFNIENGQEIPDEILEDLKVTKDDFDEALKFVQPSAMREVLIETPNISWDDIGGIDSVKRDLREAIEWPLKYPNSFLRMGIRPPKGVLLYGPPGTGKTLLAKAVAKESEVNFIKLNGPELQKEGIIGKETERLRKMFKRAKQVSPSIIFIDEIDSFAKRRGGYGSVSDSNESLINTLLTELDGLEDLKNVIVIGATNRPDILDPALMRPGRFDRIVYVPVPEREERLKIFKIHTRGMPLDKDIDLLKLADETEGYTGADIESLAREAAILALRENIEANKVTKKHFETAMEKVRPSVSKSDQERYKQIEQKYLRSAKAALSESASYTG